MRVSEVLAGLEGVDPSSDIRVWADGMRVMTTRYGTPVDSTDRGLRIVSSLRTNPYDDEAEDDEPKLLMPKKSIGFRKLLLPVQPKWKLDEATYFSTQAGMLGTSDVIHYLDQDATKLEFAVATDGSWRSVKPLLRAWCGQYSYGEEAISRFIPEGRRLCKTCERKFDEWHAACETCGVIWHVDDMHNLGGDRYGDGGLVAVPAECESCFSEREKIEAPYRRVVGGELG